MTPLVADRTFQAQPAELVPASVVDGVEVTAASILMEDLEARRDRGDDVPVRVTAYVVENQDGPDRAIALRAG